ncbi:zinc finger MYM-type protein 3 isoform X2 [Protopterus annectens]|uniref:zinc finger MYM-type protein 3 isoform X2 n=1 Tax=Protopterus annectens TaxID=7888 RepID=UPI001CF9886F|nr:zinc finger MYM-type protein 3 isoform X2 [Protopterus annectens]
MEVEGDCIGSQASSNQDTQTAVSSEPEVNPTKQLRSKRDLGLREKTALLEVECKAELCTEDASLAVGTEEPTLPKSTVTASDKSNTLLNNSENLYSEDSRTADTSEKSNSLPPGEKEKSSLVSSGSVPPVKTEPELNSRVLRSGRTSMSSLPSAKEQESLPLEKEKVFKCKEEVTEEMEIDGPTFSLDNGEDQDSESDIATRRSSSSSQQHDEESTKTAPKLSSDNDSEKQTDQSITPSGEIKKEEVVQEYRRAERLRRTESVKTDATGAAKYAESIPLSDEDSDAMVDDPKDEDFIPCRPRRSTRMSMRAPTLPRPPRAPMPKMMCASCRTPLQKGQTAYQRKGLPQLFCSSACLTTYAKKSVSSAATPPPKKFCNFCKKELVNKDSLTTQSGSSGIFKEYCSSTCLSLYEAQMQKNTDTTTETTVVTDTTTATNTAATAPQPAAAATTTDESDKARCTVCHKSGEIQHEVSNGTLVHRICSDDCFTKFRATKGLKTNCCDNCGIYIYNKGLPLEYLYHEGQQKRFCNSNCLNIYKKKNTKVYPCMWCKTLCKNFEMLSSVDKSGKTGLFCSICCITSHKVKQSGPVDQTRPCSFCRRSLSQPVYYNKTDRVVYQFCSPRCWTKFQSSPEGGIHLNCHYCQNIFSGKPEILDWQDKIYQFCCRQCCEDYKRLSSIVSVCEYCKQEKLLHEKIKFSGVEKNFCSEGCVLLYKQDFTKNLGLCCITCTYCSQTCQRAVTEELDGNTWDFCCEDCKSKYLLWYFKAARCHACKRQGKLLETIHWRGEIKHFCNQQCLLRFYNQQNQPNLDTQKGPESLLNSQTPESKPAPATPQKLESSVPTAKSPTGTAAAATQSPGSPPPSSSPPATVRKNKAAMCKPLMQNRGVSCRTESKMKGCQTEEEWKPQVIVLPVPVPIFVPVPMQMYTQKTPVPLAMPVPVPIPMFLPTTLESADKIVDTIEELKVKIPSNPLEADILAMAEMIAEAEEMEKASSDLCDLASNQSADGLLEDCDLFGPARDDVLAMAVKMANVLEEPGQDLEADFPKNPLDLNTNVDFLFDYGLDAPDDVSAEHEMPRAIKKSHKRVAVSESCSRDSLSSQPPCTSLHYTYGVNAWKHWVQTKHSGEVADKSDELKFGPKPMRIKEDILSCTAAELNYGLAQFVKEITRPNGERYEPDSIYYLCLGIQQYLLENNRMVNIFTDLYYLTFVQELNKVLSGWQPSVLQNGMIFSRVEEEHLWECKQLGVYSPFVLLNTLMFFNTKYFGIRSIEEHMQLSFSSVVRQSRKCTTPRGTTKVVSIRYCPPVRHKKSKEISPGKRKREDDVAPVLEQRENRMNPLRCPVKFYEFYLSKCPDSMRNRSDVFYLQPERSCIAESPLWYSVIPIDRAMLEGMLNRILAVREIYEDHVHSGVEDDMD